MGLSDIFQSLKSGTLTLTALKMGSIILDVSLDARNPNADFLLVVPVLIAEEVDQGEFFDVDSSREKPPGHDGVDERANRVAQNDLKVEMRFRISLNPCMAKTKKNQTSYVCGPGPIQIRLHNFIRYCKIQR